MKSLDDYQNPLIERYASKEMSYLFSPNFKFQTWRKLWILLAENQRKLGLPISKKQIDALKKAQDKINYKAIAKLEKKYRHDVMAHIHGFAQVAPEASGIIHLGATSAFVGDNTDLIQIKEALELTRKRLVNVIHKLKSFAKKNRQVPTLAFTHFQAAQLTTIGKRACLWIQEFLMDLEDLNHQLSSLRCRGVKGTTGTQASFLALFEGNHKKVKQLDQSLAKDLGFLESYPVTGQTVSRKIDSRVLGVLSHIAQSAHRIANDWRLLSHLKEIEEPFEKHQVGSSAMAYKRNPMRSERVTALARYVINQAQNPAYTAACQWFERTLDDSANKRLAIPEAFLAIDSILLIANHVISGLHINRKVIDQHVLEEIPLMATENILMASVKAGGDRQKIHEVIRRHSQASIKKSKETGKSLDLIERLTLDPLLTSFDLDWKALLNPKVYVGRAPEQVDEFLSAKVTAALKGWNKLIDKGHVELKV